MAQQKSPTYRDRFGFKLTGHQRDRVVADWIDGQPNASETIKSIIYSLATQQQMPPVYSGAVVEDVSGGLDYSDPRVQVLMGMET